LAVDFLLQHRKVLAYLLHVKSADNINPMRRLGNGTHPTSSQFRSTTWAEPSPENCADSGSRATTSRSRCSRTCGEFIRSRHSLATASSNKSRAETSSK